LITKREKSQEARMDRVAGMAVFTKVVATGSFSAAARELRVSQASVTKQIKELEGRLEQAGSSGCCPTIRRPSRRCTHCIRRVGISRQRYGPLLIFSSFASAASLHGTAPDLYDAQTV
jgi:hypothetical protein